MHHALDYVEITVVDLASARTFYESAFGWTRRSPRDTAGPSCAGAFALEGEVARRPRHSSAAKEAGSRGDGPSANEDFKNCAVRGKAARWGSCSGLVGSANQCPVPG